MIFNYGGVVASGNIMVSRLLEGENGTYFNLKLDENEVSWIGMNFFITIKYLEFFFKLLE